jgi:5-methylcytosine-specific restriction protein B
MSIMVDFTRESIQKAIEIIDQNPDLRKGRESLEYNLEFEGKYYPPILVLSEASKVLGGPELLLSNFNNSTKDPFDKLKSLGFVIIPRIANYYDQLKLFIEQSELSDLKTSHFSNSFLGLKVKVSFGQGSPARVPWIAFLGGSNTVSNGIYPVYLYYKSKKLLILAYGVSDTNKPKYNWPIANGQTISHFFRNQNLGEVDRYGESYVYSSYNLVNPLDKQQVNKDINELISIYKKVLKAQGENGNTFVPEKSFTEPPLKNSDPTLSENMSFDYHEFKTAIFNSNLFIENRLTLRFIASLLSKPFVLLTGLSGSGKTKLALALAKWITDNESQMCVVPVGADWTNREPLLGYPNALENGKYILPENGVLSLLLEANKTENVNKPFFLILDEMNLSHVERYFADFLSAMESSEPIPLHSECNDWSDAVPSKVRLTPNVFIIGTVNIDETTYMFSPKVLDRASVIEFRITEQEIRSFLLNGNNVNLEKLRSKGVKYSMDFTQLATNKIQVTYQSELNEYLLSFFKALKPLGAEFGYRTASEVLRFASIIKTLEPSLSVEEITDAAIMQKLLPKVHGSRRKLEPVLKTLGSLCLMEGQNFEELLEKNISVANGNNSNYRFPISFEKIQRMFHGLLNNGYTSYAEA